MTMNLTIASIKIIAFSALILGLYTQAAHAQEPVESVVRLKTTSPLVTTNIKALIDKVLKNPSLKVKAELKGDIANNILTKTKGKPPVYVEVSAINKLVESGCYRVGIAFTLPNTYLVRSDGAPSESLAFWQQMNLCESGLAPSTKEGALPLSN